MSNIEIKIWANPQGFAEVTRKLPSVIFTEEEKQLFNPDSYDGLKVNEYVSVFYAQQAYVVSLHFFVSSKLHFRDERTILSVIIPRGYKLLNLYDVLTDLKRKYEQMLDERLTDINDLVNTLSQEVPTWMAEYSEEDKLVVDDLQPAINMPGRQTAARGYVAFDGQDALRAFLDAPLRLDFKGASIMLFIPRSVVDDVSSQLNFLGILPVNAEPKYTPKYSMFFPAYQDTPIAIISSLDEELNKRFEKPYCKPIVLIGRYSDHLNEWKIERTPDRTGYTIGLRFEEQEQSIPIQLTFVDLYGRQANPRNVETWLIPSIGTICPSGNGYELVLRGEQIAIAKEEVTFNTNREEFLLSKVSIDNSGSFNIYVEEVFYYDVSLLKETIQRNYGFLPIVYYSDHGNWKRLDARMPFKGNRKDYKLVIQESDGYKEAIFAMDKPLNNVRLEEKKGNIVQIEFVGEIRSWLKANEYNAVTVLIDRGLYESQGAVLLNLKDNFLKLPPKAKSPVNYQFKARGFKTKYDTIDPKAKEPVKLNMERVWWTKLLRSRKAIAFAALFIGFFLGFYYNKFSLNEMEKELKKKDDIILRLRQQVQDLSHGQDVDVSEYKQNEDNADPEEGTKSSPGGTDQQQEPTQQVKQEPKPSTELANQLEKLKGIEFTRTDLDNAKKKAEAEGLAEQNKKLFEACEFALGVVSGRSKSADYVKKRLSDKSLTTVQKNAILDIISDREVYNSDNKTYATLKAMLDVFLQ